MGNTASGRARVESRFSEPTKLSAKVAVIGAGFFCLGFLPVGIGGSGQSSHEVWLIAWWLVAASLWLLAARWGATAFARKEHPRRVPSELKLIGHDFGPGATVTIERPVQNASDLLRKYDVMFDGRLAASIGFGEYVTVECQPGQHVLQAKFDRFDSERLRCNVEVGGTYRYAVVPSTATTAIRRQTVWLELIGVAA